MKRHFSFFPRLQTLLPALAAGAAMGGALWVLRDVPVPVLLPAGAGLYAGLLYALSPRSRAAVLGVRG